MVKKSIILLLAIFITQVMFAAAYVKFDGVDGESQDSQHEGEIDVLSWSWGTTSNAKASCLNDVVIVKNSDIATPVLLMDQVIGKEYSTAILSVSRPALTRVRDYLVIVFKNVRVNTIAISGSGSDERPTEQITFSFDELTYTYFPLSNDRADNNPIVKTIRSAGNCKK